MMRGDYLKKNSSKAPGKFSRSSEGYKAVFKKSRRAIWTYFLSRQYTHSIQKTVFSVLVNKNF